MAELIPKSDLQKALNADWIAVHIYENHVAIHIIKNGVKSKCELPVLQVLARRPKSARIAYAVECFAQQET